jgi:hypothetical protein
MMMGGRQALEGMATRVINAGVDHHHRGPHLEGMVTRAIHAEADHHHRADHRPSRPPRPHLHPLDHRPSRLKRRGVDTVPTFTIRLVA